MFSRLVRWFRRHLWLVPVALVGVLIATHLHRPRPQRAPDLCGLWVMSWQGTEGRARFNPDGSYVCAWRGAMWLGTWRLRGCRLEVVESKPTAPDRVVRWSVELEPDLPAGRLSTGGWFELRRVGVEFESPQP